MIMFTHLLIIAAILMSASDKDETLRTYAGSQTNWVLVEMKGAPFEAKATMHFPEAGVISGQAPCNSYRAELLVPYPWFDTGPIAATRRACPDMNAEAEFFQALRAASLSEVREGVLVLSDEDSELLVFKAAD